MFPARLLSTWILHRPFRIGRGREMISRIELIRLGVRNFVSKAEKTGAFLLLLLAVLNFLLKRCCQLARKSVVLSKSRSRRHESRPCFKARGRAVMPNHRALLDKSGLTLQIQRSKIVSGGQRYTVALARSFQVVLVTTEYTTSLSAAALESVPMVVVQ